MILLAGREKAGKTWGALTASASPLIARTLYVGIGEDDPDEYALIPGAEFEIVVHDGTYAGILQAVRDVAALPWSEDGRPNLLVVDSMTKLWDLVVDNMQQVTNERAKEKARQGRQKQSPDAAGDYSISTDLWNVAKTLWDDVVNAIRSHRGPSILTARLDEVMVMKDGQPTKDKQWKVQAHKSLVFDVAVVVEMHSRGHALITGTKSVRMALEKPERADGLTVTSLWDRLGIAEGVSERMHTGTVVDQADLASVVERWRKRAEDQLAAEDPETGLTQVWKDAQRAEVPTPVLDAIRKVASDYKAERRAAEQLPGTEPDGNAEPRDFLLEAQAKGSHLEVIALHREAQALGADAAVLEDLEAIAAEKDTPQASAPAGEWAAGEGAPDEWDQTPAVLAADDPEAARKDATEAAVDAAEEGSK